MYKSNKTLTYCFVNKHNFVHRETKNTYIYYWYNVINCDSIDVRDSIGHNSIYLANKYYYAYALNSKPSRGESVSNLNDETNC